MGRFADKCPNAIAEQALREQGMSPEEVRVVAPVCICPQCRPRVAPEPKVSQEGWWVIQKAELPKPACCLCGTLKTPGAPCDRCNDQLIFAPISEPPYCRCITHSQETPCPDTSPSASHPSDSPLGSA